MKMNKNNDVMKCSSQNFFLINQVDFLPLACVLTCNHSWNWPIFLNLQWETTAQTQIIKDVLYF